jgi:hypothetical protein
MLVLLSFALTFLLGALSAFDHFCFRNYLFLRKISANAQYLLCNEKSGEIFSANSQNRNQHLFISRKGKYREENEDMHCQAHEKR